jgi:hypothetical protein
MFLVDSDEHVPREERALDLNRAAILPTSGTLIGGEEGFDVANLTVFGDALLMTRGRIRREPLARLKGQRFWLFVFSPKTCEGHRSDLDFRSRTFAAEFADFVARLRHRRLDRAIQSNRA